MWAQSWEMSKYTNWKHSSQQEVLPIIACVTMANDNRGKHLQEWMKEEQTNALSARVSFPEKSLWSLFFLLSSKQ